MSVTDIRHERPHFPRPLEGRIKSTAPDHMRSRVIEPGVRGHVVQRSGFSITVQDGLARRLHGVCTLELRPGDPVTYDITGNPQPERLRIAPSIAPEKVS